MSVEPQGYTEGWDHLLETGVSAHTSSFKIVLVDPDYVYSAAHEDFADLGGNDVVTSNTLTGVSVTSGWLNAANPTWPVTTPGEDVAGYVVWDSTHDKLIAYSGRRRDGRPIESVTTSAGIPMRFTDGRLLRLGGVPT